jgi:hypothetical protein
VICFSTARTTGLKVDKVDNCNHFAPLLHVVEIRQRGEIFQIIRQILHIPVLPAPIDKGFDVSDVFVERRSLYFLASIKNELVDGVLCNLSGATSSY